MQNNALPTGFITVQEAIDLINADTRSEATVDTAFLLRNLPFLRVDGNYTIRKLKHEDGHVVENGHSFVHIGSDYERIMLQQAITEHYRNVTGKIVDANTIGLRSLTTAVDDENNAGGLLMVNDQPMAKPGDIISNSAVERVIGG